MLWSTYHVLASSPVFVVQFASTTICQKQARPVQYVKNRGGLGTRLIKCILELNLICIPCFSCLHLLLYVLWPYFLLCHDITVSVGILWVRLFTLCPCGRLLDGLYTFSNAFFMVSTGHSRDSESSWGRSSRCCHAGLPGVHVTCSYGCRNKSHAVLYLHWTCKHAHQVVKSVMPNALVC